MTTPREADPAPASPRSAGLPGVIQADDNLEAAVTGNEHTSQLKPTRTAAHLNSCRGPNQSKSVWHQTSSVSLAGIVFHGS